MGDILSEIHDDIDDYIAYMAARPDPLSRYVSFFFMLAKLPVYMQTAYLSLPELTNGKGELPLFAICSGKWYRCTGVSPPSKICLHEDLKKAHGHTKLATLDEVQAWFKSEPVIF